MIFYFSATGNSRYTAERIAETTGERAVSISECMKSSSFEYSLGQDEQLGIVLPVYAWGLPGIASDFLKKLNVTAPERPYTFFVCTYGCVAGQAGTFTDMLLRRKGHQLDARFDIKMPDTWTPVFDLSDQKKVQKINENAETEILFAARKIKDRARGDFMKNKAPLPAAFLLNRLVYPVLCGTWHFSVKRSCIGCGSCAAACPVKAIQMKNGRPVWVRRSCTACLGCLHRCPRFAIRYGFMTGFHGQYQNPHTAGGNRK